MRLMGLVVSLALGFQAWAEGPSRPATQADSKCQTTADRYAPAVSLTEASPQFKGQCLDVQVFRSALRVSDDGQRTQIANFIHDNQYWVASFPKNHQVFDKAFYQIQRFPVVKGVEAAHVQLRIRLKPDHFIELQNQLDPSQHARVNSFILSFEAGRPAGTEYNFALGAFDNYVLVGRVASGEQRWMERKTTATEQYELALSAQEIAELTLAGLARSEARGVNQFYNTLRPNCTTELIDLLDALPRFKGKFSPFLTVISPDPIARPSLEALERRQLLRGRVQDMNTEFSGPLGKKDQKLPMPTKKAAELSFLPQVAGLPWTLVMATPDDRDLTPSEREAVAQIQKDVVRKIPLFLQGLGAVLMLNANSDQKSAAVMAYVFDKVQSELVRGLREMNTKLTPQIRTLGLYLVPYDNQGKTLDLESLGVPAALPFQLVEEQVDPENSRSQSVFLKISEGSRRAADRGQKMKTQFYLQAVALKIQLQKDHSSSTSQVLLGLNPMNRPFAMTNSQVKFNEIQIPRAEDRIYRSVLLLTQRQEAFSKDLGNLAIDFGAEGGIAGSLDRRRFAQFQILQGADCALQTQSVPNLVGEFGEAPLQNGFVNLLLQGKPVSFGIFGADLNLRTQNVDQMKIRVATWPLRCLSLSQVDNQFKDEANSMLEKYKSEISFENLLQRLLGETLR